MIAVAAIIGVGGASVYLAYGAACAAFHVISHVFSDEPWRKRDALGWLLIWPVMLRREGYEVRGRK